MPRFIGRLTELKVRNSKPPNGRRCLLADGGNLYLQVSVGEDGNIRRSWVFRFQRPGQPQRDMGLGSIHDIGLADARELARVNRLLVKQGIDPIVKRKTEFSKNLLASTGIMTFKTAAETYINQHRASWKAVKHDKLWQQTLRDYCYPKLGRMSVADIETAHVVEVLAPIWTEKVVTAKRVRQRIEAILGWATASGYRKDQHGHDRPNPARWKGHLDKLLAAPSKVSKVKHHTALAYDDVPVFLADLRSRNGTSSLALEFLILTCVRTADVRAAKWENIDRTQRLWIIPALSKTGKEHRVPLSAQSLAVLDKVETITRSIGGPVAQSEYIFSNDRTGKPFQKDALLQLIERMGRKADATSHGFRSAFRTWAAERTNFPWELAEMSLGHVVGSAVERAYQRGDMHFRNGSPSCGHGRTFAVDPSSTRPMWWCR